MPKILDRLVQQLKDKGYGDNAARAIATSSLQKSGNLKKGSTEPTAKGLVRGDMTPGERATDRAMSYSKKKRKESDYVYNEETNRSTLRKGRR